MAFRRAVLLVGVVAATTSPLRSQQPAVISGAQFDVVSIKRNSEMNGVALRTLPDGTLMMTNQPLWSILIYASPVPVLPRNVKGAPNWVTTDRYDIIAKPAPDSHPTREQRIEMMRNLLIERFKLGGHVAEEEQTTFALVVARSDRRLGPQLKKSEVECTPPLSVAAPPPGPSTPPRCVVRMGAGSMEVTGMPFDRLVNSFNSLAGGQVFDRTGLEGGYDFTLHFAPPGLNANASTTPDDAPQFVTALQEQLGLKLVPEKTKVTIFVIDHIERPTPN
ncbi:MAG: TIGR03435 family protein [Acidobacteriia bacterium]|nr:TIGR03435 family protein [Terriglobia bacterium]